MCIAVPCGVLGGFIALLNFYLSFLRYPIHKRFHSDQPWHYVSGFPLIGTILLMVPTMCIGDSAWLWLPIAFMLMDTGGPHWFIISIAIIQPLQMRGTRKKNNHS